MAGCCWSPEKSDKKFTYLTGSKWWKSPQEMPGGQTLLIMRKRPENENPAKKKRLHVKVKHFYCWFYFLYNETMSVYALALTSLMWLWWWFCMWQCLVFIAGVFLSLPHMTNVSKHTQFEMVLSYLWFTRVQTCWKIGGTVVEIFQCLHNQKLFTLIRAIISSNFMRWNWSNVRKNMYEIWFALKTEEGMGLWHRTLQIVVHTRITF